MAIAIDLLFTKKPTIGFNLIIKKILKKFKAIKNKINTYIKVIPLLKVNKFWVQVAALILVKYILRAYILEVIV